LWSIPSKKQPVSRQLYLENTTVVEI